MKTNTIAHKDTHSFSDLVCAYLAQDEFLKPFYKYEPNLNGIRQAIEERKKNPVDRETLVAVLFDQYKDYNLSDDFRNQLNILKSANTFTVCTAHQPDLMTGYLYFFYKIIHAARLATYLKEQFPENNFVPVFYIGSEDNDIEELSVFHYEGKTYRWTTGQTGAVGRMNTADLQELIAKLKADLIPPGVNKDRLSEIIAEAYDGQKTIAQAIRYIVHAFLSPLGVMVLDADDARLKRNYLAVMREELLQPVSGIMVQETSKLLAEKYRTQAYPRAINLFYLTNDLRERIEKDGQGWKVVNTDIRWDDEATLLDELENYPERFSPNVILRGPYQEQILPDVAFIGGGSEVAYWMQLGEVFKHYHIFFPVLVLRQSALWMDNEARMLQQKLRLSDESLFLTTDEIKKQIVMELSGPALDISEELQDLMVVLERLKIKAENIDATLSGASKAVKAKVSHQTNRLEKKMIRAAKRRAADKMRQIDKLKSLIFPNQTLQERYDCFLSLYLTYGQQFIEQQYRTTQPWGDRFLIHKDDD